MFVLFVFLFVYIIHSCLFKLRDIYSKKRTIASFQSLVDGQFSSSRSFLPCNARCILLSKVVTNFLHLPTAVIIFISLRTVNPTAYYHTLRCHNPEDHDIIFRLPGDFRLNFAAHLTTSNLYIFSSILE